MVFNLGYINDFSKTEMTLPSFGAAKHLPKYSIDTNNFQFSDFWKNYGKTYTADGNMSLGRLCYQNGL